MSKYPHYITRVGEGNYPTLIMCVDCKTDLQWDNYPRDRQKETLVSWHVSVLKADSKCSKLVGDYSGVDAPEFWKLADVLASWHKYVLLLSYQCVRQWTLLHFWEGIENGLVTIAERGSRREQLLRYEMQRVRKASPNPLSPSPAALVSAVLRQAAGLIVTEDPPCFAAFSCNKSRAEYTWLDCRNHGVEIAADILCGAGRATELASWYVGYSDMLRRYNLGAIKLTAGQQAFRGWRQSYYDGGVYVHTHKEAGEIESASYHGGRCECFRVGAIPADCRLLDVRSMYPSICSEHCLPARLLSYTDSPSESERIGREKPLCCIGRVTLRTEYPDYPLRRDGITIWPTGTYTTALAGPELADALAYGRILKWHSLAVYDMSFCLKRYADAIYEARLKGEVAGNQAVAQSIKKLLVSLPGKFAQRGRRWVNVPDMACVVFWGEWYGSDDAGRPCRYRAIAGLVQRDIDTGAGAESAPAISSWITAQGRMVLLSAIRIAGWSECYYCDTDSLIVSKLGYQRMLGAGLVVRRCLGFWQLKETIGDGHIFGIKHYHINGRTVFAGYPSGAIAETGDGTHYWHYGTVADACSIGLPIDQARTLRTYNSSGQYRHGAVGPDGRVYPIHLDEE